MSAETQREPITLESYAAAVASKIEAQKKSREDLDTANRRREPGFVYHDASNAETAVRDRLEDEMVVIMAEALPVLGDEVVIEQVLNNGAGFYSHEFQCVY